MSIKRIVIGTRGSQLSLVQTNIVKDLLQDLLPSTVIEITTIKTSGDKNMSPIPLDTIGKGWFTKEIDKQLLEGTIDVAVHSLKDLLDTLTPGLVITAIPQREDASEALISRNGFQLEKLKKGAVIGSDSIRRKIQILRMRPDLIVKSVRGNVNKRLEKLDSGEYDGLILAVAGLNRLDLQERVTQDFDPTDFIPSPGQGALAVVTRESNKELNNILSKIIHTSSITAVTAEREFSKATGGGCSMPVGAYAEIKGKTIILYGMLGSEDEKHMIKDVMSGNIKDPKGLGQQLANKMLQQTLSWQNRDKPKYVVLTREAKANDSFIKQLDILGLHAFSYPSISVSKNLSLQAFKKYLTDISSYDWLLFTSSNGIRFFIEGIKETGNDIATLKQINTAVVGEKTAETAKSFGLSVTLIPKIFTAKDLVNAIPAINGKKILLPRSTIANAEVRTQLEKKGAIVTDMPVYKTEYANSQSTELKMLLQKNQILCLTFTSPSTVEGFLKSIDTTILKDVLSLPVFSIGPVTTTAAKKHGFTNIYTADIHTTDGMLTKLKESIL